MGKMTCWNVKKRWPLFVAVYLIPAVLGTFAFSTAQSLDANGYSQRAAAGTVHALDGDGVILPNEPEIDWLYENHAVSKANSHGSLSARYAPLRAFIADSRQPNAPFFLAAAQVVRKQADTPDTRRQQPLKLRI